MGNVVARQRFLEGLVVAGLTTTDVMDEGHVEHDDSQVAAAGREADGRLRLRLLLLVLFAAVIVHEVGLGGIETQRLGVCHEATGTAQTTLEGIALTSAVVFVGIVDGG